MLAKQLVELEKNVGTFSRYETCSGPGETIPFELKPAQQLLAGLACSSNKAAALSCTINGSYIPSTGNPEVTIYSFEEDDALTIRVKVPGARIDRFVNSAKTYVNTDIIDPSLFFQSIRDNCVKPQDKSIAPGQDDYWQNLAVGICHVQEIDLLVEQRNDGDSKAIAYPREKPILTDDPAILLLSSPALNFAYGTANFLSPLKQVEYIEGMYRNLFSAALAEKRNYIAMPAAGLGVFAGKPALYFNALMKVAKEFPDLNIIFHPAQFGKDFDQALAAANLTTNVVKASKDVVFIADELTKQGYPCALHNPSDADVVYGVYDVGEYWKNGKGNGYVGEEHIGAMSTAPLNSLGLNPNAYTQTVARSFKEKPVLVETVELAPTPVKPSTVETKTKTTVPDLKVKDKKAKAKVSSTILSEHPEEEVKPTAKPAQKSSLNQQQTARVLELYWQLMDEKESCWIYPNKDLKQVKIDALDELRQECETKSLSEAIISTQNKYPSLMDGFFSTRTASLFKDLKIESKTSLSADQYRQVRDLIFKLQAEIDSVWPYPNKDLKQIKVNALIDLIYASKKMPLAEVLQKFDIHNYPGVFDGALSTRTASLFKELEESVKDQNLFKTV